MPGELIAHTGAGSQDTSIGFTDHLAEAGIRPLIGTVAGAYDNALMECVIVLYKTECVRTPVLHAGPLRTSAMSSSPLPAGSTDTTTGACTARLR